MKKPTLKPIGALANEASTLAADKMPTLDIAAAQKALQDDKFSLQNVIANSRFTNLTGRLTNEAERLIAGDQAVQVIVALRGNLADSGLRVSEADLARCMEKALRLRTSRGGTKFRATSAATQGANRAARATEGYENAFSGELRERVVQNLPAVRMLTDNLRTRARAAATAANKKGARLIDTAFVGDVRLATLPSDGGIPVQNALGPDRLIGFVTREGKSKDIAGTLHVTGIIEIKATTGALAGVDQTQKFIARASHTEITIGRKTYKIVYDEKTLSRSVILPETAIDRRRTQAFAKANGINVLPYPASVEKIITETSRIAVSNLVQLDRLLR